MTIFNIQGSSKGRDYYMPSESVIKPIEKRKDEKDLGVVMDSKLNFRQNIPKEVIMAKRNLGMINCAYTYLNQKMFLS